MSYVKLAVKRRNDGIPEGQLGNMYIDCLCGKQVSIPNDSVDTQYYPCTCGRWFNDRGYLYQRPVQYITSDHMELK